MEQPWKVIAAFIGVFVAGAVFGAFVALGTGSRWAAVQPAPVAPPAPVATVANPTPEKPAPARPANQGQAAAAAPRPAALQIPQGWQAPQILRRYSERLDLTPEQKEHLRPLFQRAAEDYRRVQQNTFRDTGIILLRLQQDIAKELTPPQREKLKQWEDAQREKLQKADPRAKDVKRPNGGQPKAGVRMQGEGAATSSGAAAADAGASSPSPSADSEKKE